MVTDGSICSLCCGEKRNEEACLSCSFYKAPSTTRKYGDVPSYSTIQMEASYELQDYANTVESTICAFDRQTGHTIKDPDAIRILELLLDKYHFNDETMLFDNELIESGFDLVDNAIEKDLSDVPVETIVKILKVIHFVAKRRTTGRREYLRIIQGYVGERIAPGLRLMQDIGRFS
jgi:hypothetical protein